MIVGVYVLCALTALGCALLLVRAWRRASTPLLLWCAAGFAALAAANVLLVVDLVIVPDVDLRLVRNLTFLGGVAVILRGLLRDTAEVES